MFKQGLKKFSSDVSLIIVCTLLWSTANGIIEFVFPTYLKSIGQSYIMIGLLLSMASISAILLDLPFGVLSDHYSRKKLMILGLILSPLFGILIFIFKNNITLLLLFLLWGLAYQLWQVPRDAYFASLTKKKTRTETYGLSNEFEGIGYTLGPLIGGILLSRYGFMSITVSYTLFIFLAILVIFFIKKRHNGNTQLKKELIHSFQYKKVLNTEFKYLSIKGIKTVLAFALLIAVFDAIVWTLEPLLYNSLELTHEFGALILAAFSLPQIIFSVPAGKIARKIGKVNSLTIGLVVTATSLMAFSQFKNPMILVLLAVTGASGMAIIYPSIQSILVDLSYRKTKGKLLGLWNLMLDIGYVIGPILAGISAEIVGIHNTFGLYGIVIIGSILLGQNLRKLIPDNFVN